MVAAPDGGVWFTEINGSNIGRMTADGTVTESPLTPGAAPASITFGADGALWFTELGADKIGRMTTGGVLTDELPVPTAGALPAGITLGWDGNVWFGEVVGKVGRVTVGGTITEFPLPTPDSQPRVPTPGPDGHMWVAAPATHELVRVSLGTPWTVDTASGTAAQSTTVDQAFAQPLGVVVADADGTPLEGITVTFSAPSSGASATFADGASSATAVTDANGVATSPTPSASATAGTYDVTATADLANTRATFALTNEAVATTPSTTPAASTAATLPATGMTDRSRRDTIALALAGLAFVLLGLTALGARRIHSTR